MDDKIANILAKIGTLTQLSKRDHYYCEDSWYSCPKAIDGCSNPEYDDSMSEIEKCNCGADEHNELVCSLIESLISDLYDFRNKP